MGMVAFSALAVELAGHVNAVYEDNQVFVVERYKKPVAVLISHELWQVGQQRVVDPASSQDMNARRAQASMKAIREQAEIGVHTILTVDQRPKAVVVPYVWARSTFPELGLPETAQPVHSALVVYRSPRHLAELETEFATAADPAFEMDRRLSAGPTRIPAIRRDQLDAIVYVHDGVVARVRGIDPTGRWEDLPGPFSLAPVSEPLTALQIERKLPALALRPGDKQEPRWGTWREYIDLTPAN